MNGAGYLIANKNGTTGEAGLFFDYIISGNGLFLSTRNNQIEALFCLSPVPIRGLRDTVERIVLLHGKIPRALYDLAEDICFMKTPKECCLSIVWKDGEYHMDYPEQTGTGGQVEYTLPENVVLDLHSHGSMPAFFSGTDDGDDQGFKFSMVIGKVEDEPEYRLRLCCYGYFHETDFGEVFE